MSPEIIDILRTGRVPYRYEYDAASALYFGLAVLAIIFVFNLVQAFTRRLIG